MAQVNHQEDAMARLLQHTLVALTIPQLGFAAMTLFLCGFALFMCASHSRTWRSWSACYGLYEPDPVIHVNYGATMATVDCHDVEESIRDESLFSSVQQQEASVWQKNILMGGKCQLPDFSGVIIYNSEGKIVTPAKPRPLLTWK